uniref:U5 snRNP-specific protein n=1 Tax=Gonium pectorale TaxID=33097 RepID=A0A140JWX0_GONPE|nr:U5 snRNP-specific protein [Gonium pectorale]
MAEKRAHPAPAEDEESLSIVPSKKAKHDEDAARASALPAPNVQLCGHEGEVSSLRFSPDGQCLATAGSDKAIFCWRVFHDNENTLVIQGHTNAVLEVHWFSDGSTLLSSSADKTVRCWDAESGTQVKKVNEHTGIVNSCCPQRRGGLFVSGADDGTIKVWDTRVKRSVHTLRCGFPVCAVAFADAADQVFSGGVDNAVKVWDLRGDSSSPCLLLKGHSDTVTGLRLSPDGSHVLSNAMDNTLREWDIRPYAPPNRCTKVFTGHLHSFEKNLLRCDYSADGGKVTCGSADRMVNIWDSSSRKLIYKLPGHSGSVNEVVFHPKDPVIASASSDKTVFLGELTQ